MGHNVTPLALVLEDAAAIGIVALSMGEEAVFSRFGINSFNGLNVITGFYSIGTDVLYSTGPDLSGNER